MKPIREANIPVLIVLGILAYMGLIFTLIQLTGCGDDTAPSSDDAAPPDAGAPDAAVTDEFWRCEPDAECETGYCANLDYNFEDGPTVCTTVCQFQSDCKERHINSVCMCDFTPEGVCWSGSNPDHPATPGHCVLQCWPFEDREVCDKYGIFCPSDCAAQDLVCKPISLFPIIYGCRPEHIEWNP